MARPPAAPPVPPPQDRPARRRRVSWADVDDDDDLFAHAAPVPISFLADDLVLHKVLARGLPATREGLAIKAMLAGTDLAHLPLAPGHELTPSDLKHLKSLCYWLRTGFSRAEAMICDRA